MGETREEGGHVIKTLIHGRILVEIKTFFGESGNEYKGDFMADLTKKGGKKKNALTSNMWIYALGLMGINLSIGLINSYQAEFFNKMLGANLMIFAGILLASKFISIIADFIIGNLIDRANFKSGKMRPWILISAFPLAVLTMFTFVFTNFHSDAGMYVYITFMTILWNVSMTLADIPSQGMLALLSHDGDAKNNAAGIANTLKSIALACPGVIVTIVAMLTKCDVIGKKEYLITSGLLCGVGLVLQLLMYFKCKEEVKTRTSSAMSFKEMFRELKGNKQIVILFLTFILGFGRNIGLGIAVQATYILVRDGIDMSGILGGIFGNTVLYGDGISWIIGITSAVSSMVTIVLNPVINKKLGEKKYFIVAGFYGFIVSVICVIAYCCGTPALRSIWAILVYQFFLGVAYGPNGFLPMVMTSDIVDYQEWKTGKRTEGTQFAILSMSNKLSNALSVSAGIFLIGLIGFNASTANSIYDGTSTAYTSIEQYITNDMQNKAWIIYFLIPGLCMLASSIVMFFYKIDEKTKKQMREELALRRASENATLDAENSENDGDDEGNDNGVENTCDCNGEELPSTGEKVVSQEVENEELLDIITAETEQPNQSGQEDKE